MLIDSERATWNLRPSLLEEFLEQRARAGAEGGGGGALVGQPARMEELIAICGRHGVAFIEDAAESLGAHGGRIRDAGAGEIFGSTETGSRQQRAGCWRLGRCGEGAALVDPGP